MIRVARHGQWRNRPLTPVMKKSDETRLNGPPTDDLRATEA
jgi:hypothetical protein